MTGGALTLCQASAMFSIGGVRGRCGADYGKRHFSILFAFDSIMISVAMPMMFNDHKFLVMSVPVVVVVTVSVIPYNNRVLGIRRSVRKSDRHNTKSYK
jgi:hypothetical protein